MCSILSKVFAFQQLEFVITMLDGLVTNMNAQSPLCVLYFLPVAASMSALKSGRINSEDKTGTVEENQQLSVSHHLPCSAVHFCCVEQIT